MTGAEVVLVTSQLLISISNTTNSHKIWCKSQSSPCCQHSKIIIKPETALGSKTSIFLMIADILLWLTARCYMTNCPLTNINQPHFPHDLETLLTSLHCYNQQLQQLTDKSKLSPVHCSGPQQQTAASFVSFSLVKFKVAIVSDKFLQTMFKQCGNNVSLNCSCFSLWFFRFNVHQLSLFHSLVRRIIWRQCPSSLQLHPDSFWWLKSIEMGHLESETQHRMLLMIVEGQTDQVLFDACCRY